MPSRSPRVTSLLVVPKAIVLVGKGGTLEHAPCIHKVKPVVLQVALALNLVPRKPHPLSVYSYCIYVKTSVWLPSTFAVSGARARNRAKHSVRARVRVNCTVRQQDHSLKEVIAVGPVEFAGGHAAVLETDGRSHRDMGRCDPASQKAPCSRSQRDIRV